MKRELHLGSDPLDEPALVGGRVSSTAMGAAAYFSGIVRAREGDSIIQALSYEAFHAMAERQFGLIFDEVERRWPIQSVRLYHRLGPVEAGRTSLWIEVLAPHRKEAFDAIQFIIDDMKRLVPIWKSPLG